jgi:uncharacterized membrane protein (Fun14 family)|tara:strand:- start:79 stop:312 length:234 start_codon:yes stop_codon:yes gene_type:complete
MQHQQQELVVDQVAMQEVHKLVGQEAVVLQEILIQELAQVVRLSLMVLQGLLTQAVVEVDLEALTHLTMSVELEDQE